MFEESIYGNQNFSGYANEVGEAFRALTPLWFVRSTYGVASAYVLADTYDKSVKMYKVGNLFLLYNVFLSLWLSFPSYWIEVTISNNKARGF